MKKIMNFLTKSKGKVIIIIIIILAILSLIITFNQNKSNLNGNVGNNNKGNNTEYIPPNFGDTNFLFDSNRVSFSSDAMKSKNVKTAIDELYAAVTNGCYVGYTKGTDNGTTYVCNKAISDSIGEIDFDSANVKYNNGTSGLSASNVKDAIDELKGLVAYCSSDHHKENETSNSYECKINTLPSTLTVANSSVALTYNGSSANNTYSYNGDGEISCSSSDTTKVTCSVDTANTRITVTPVAATSTNVTITVSASQTANYYAPTDATFTVSVAKAVLTCPSMATTSKTFNNATQTYDGNACPSGSSRTSASGKNVGDYYAYFTADSNHQFSGTCNVGKMTITQAASTMSLNKSTITLTYPTSGTATITSTGDGTITCSSDNTNVATCSVSGTTLTITPKANTADNKTATITVTRNAGTNYSAKSTTISVTVNRGSLTCPTTATASYTYNGGQRSLSAAACPSGSTRDVATVTRTVVGTSYSTCTANSGYKFSGTCRAGALTINAATATFSCSDKTWNGSAQTGCTCSGCTITGGTNSATNAGGPWTVTASANANYSLSTTSKTWKINKASLTCPGNKSKSVTYNGGSQSYAGNGCPTYSTGSNASGTNVGTYYGYCTADANHAFSGTCTRATLVINKDTNKLTYGAGNGDEWSIQTNNSDSWRVQCKYGTDIRFTHDCRYGARAEVQGPNIACDGLANCVRVKFTAGYNSESCNIYTQCLGTTNYDASTQDIWRTNIYRN